MALVKQRPKQSVDRLRHSSSLCECASPVRSAFCFIGSSFGISYEKRRDRTLAVSPLSFYLHSIYPLSFSCQEDFLFLFLLFLSILLCRLFHAIAKCSEQLTQTIILSVHIYDRIGLFQFVINRLLSAYPNGITYFRFNSRHVLSNGCTLNPVSPGAPSNPGG